MSNGIDFVINGKDNAKPAMASVEQGLSRLQSGTDRLKSATQGLMSAMAPLLAVYAAVKTAMAAIGGIQAANDQFDRTAEAVKGLEVALRIQGAVVETESARLQMYADTMQNVTGINDLAVMGLMKEASLLGVTSDKLDDMTTAAIGLAEATGSDASTAMTQLRMATEGVFTSFNRSIPQLKHMATDEEKLAAVLDLAAKGFEAKATWANKTAEAGAMAGNAIDKLKESVGAILAPFRALISTGIATFANALTQLLVPAVEYAEEMLANIGPLMEWVTEKVIQGVNLMVGAFTFFEVILTNLDQVWEIAVSRAELWMLQLVGVIEHALTVAIPAYAAWFGENFVNLIRDGINLAYTVVENGITKIVDAFVALWQYVASWGETDIMAQLGEIGGRSLLDGFESSLTDLPDIAGRIISDREKELTERIGQLGANLGDEFSRKMAERMIKAGDGIGDEFNKEIDLKIKKSIGEDTGTAGGKGGSQAGNLSAMESRLLTRGQSDGVKELWERAVAALQQIMASSGSTASATDQLNKKTPQFAPEDEVKLVMVK